MKSIDFPGATLKIGANQTDIYNVIHAYPLEGQEGEVIAIYELTDEEAEQIAKNKKIYYSRLTFGGKFQPMRLQAEPVAINVKMNYEDGSPMGEFIAYITSNGIEIPGFKKNDNGSYERFEEIAKDVL